MPIKTLQIVASDEIYNISALQELGQLQTFASQSLSQLPKADVLVVNSTTKVSLESVLDMGVKLVCTVTSGTEHINTEALQLAGVEVKTALGANAQAVVEYVYSAVALWLKEYDQNLGAKKLAILGCGKVGGRLLASPLANLASEVVCYDPFVKPYDRLSQDFWQSDIVSLHCALTRTGNHPTAEMVDRRQINAINKQGLLINAARGSVFASSLQPSQIQPNLVLDVYPHEPNIDRQWCRCFSTAERGDERGD